MIPQNSLFNEKIIEPRKSLFCNFTPHYLSCKKGKILPIQKAKYRRQNIANNSWRFQGYWTHISCHPCSGSVNISNATPSSVRDILQTATCISGTRCIGQPVPEPYFLLFTRLFCFNLHRKHLKCSFSLTYEVNNENKIKKNSIAEYACHISLHEEGMVNEIFS